MRTRCKTRTNRRGGAGSNEGEASGRPPSLRSRAAAEGLQAEGTSRPAAAQSHQNGAPGVHQHKVQGRLAWIQETEGIDNVGGQVGRQVLGLPCPTSRPVLHGSREEVMLCGLPTKREGEEEQILRALGLVPAGA